MRVLLRNGAYLPACLLACRPACVRACFRDQTTAGGVRSAIFASSTHVSVDAIIAPKPPPSSIRPKSVLFFFFFLSLGCLARCQCAFLTSLPLSLFLSFCTKSFLWSAPPARPAAAPDVNS
ncbi:hypothetical protein BKA80DRAFT_258839 [Phyllosticta citrichinensis]